MGFRMIAPRRIRKVKSQNSQEVLRRLEEYLESTAVTGEPVEILCGFWKDQQNAITYQELRHAVQEGEINQELLSLWQQDYSVLVAGRLSGLWTKAIAAGSEGQPILDSLAFAFNTQTPGVLSWISEHGAEFVTASTREQKDAIAALLTKKMRDSHTVDELSRLIRPCIGLTEGDAKAAAKFYDSIVANLRKEHPRMKPETIRRRALDATQKYAERKHRARAMTIAQTESAFAYNRGADEGIRQAQTAGYLGIIKKRWSTSGDDAVCAMCNALDGVEIAMDAEFNITGRILFPGHHLMPPAHPRCACAVEYIEILPPASTVMENNDAEPQDSTMEKLGEIDPEKTKEALEYYEELFRDDAMENVLVIDSQGGVFYAKGDASGVDIRGINLKGAFITHNHPVSNGIVSFGEDDFYFLKEHQDTMELRCVNSKYDYSVSVLKDMSGIMYNDIYVEALQRFQEEGFEAQHIAMEVLRERGFVRYVRKKADKGTGG